MKKVKVNKSDAPTPGVNGALLTAKSPFVVTLAFEQGKSVKTGLVFDCPVLLYPAEGLRRQGVSLVNESNLVYAGQEVVLQLLSSRPDTILLERGDVLCNVLPLTEQVKLIVG